MDEKKLLLIYASVVIFVIATFFMGRRSQTPTRLRFQTKKSNSGALQVNSSEQKGQDFGPAANQNPGQNSAAEKNLSVHFNFNGETFEAYETIGVPAGSSIDQIKAHLAGELRKGPPSNLQVVKEALRAIDKATSKGAKKRF